MSTCTEAERLTDLARILLTTVTDDDPPVAVGVGEQGESNELHLKPLLDGDPAVELRGFHAPEHWQAFGIAAPARLRSLDADGPAPTSTSFVFLVSRSGASVSIAGTGLDEPHYLETTGAQEGRLADACRRVLGLATPPPPSDARLWFALQWLDAACAHALDRGDTLSWPALVDLYPLLTPTLRAEFPGPACEYLTMLGNAAGSALTWQHLRAQAIADDPAGCRLAAHEAAWTDEGTFARIMLEPYPELSDLLDALAVRLGGDSHEQLLVTLGAWDCL